MSASHSAVEVFCSYAHEDDLYRKQLETHVSALKRQGLILLWHDRQILPGANWAKTIDAHLETASIIVLLISADFINSDYGYGVEMKRALERHEANEAHVIPIIVRSCDWQNLPIGQLQALPVDARPISEWTSVDAAWTEVVAGLRRVIEDLSHLSASAPASTLPKPDSEVSISLASAQQRSVFSNKFYSCFISCSSHDLDFAGRLYADLKNEGVRCWFAPDHMKIGDKIRSRIEESIRTYDKVLLILSEHSVASQWVGTEVEAAFERERQQNKSVLFPIKLDETVMQTEESWAADIRRMRHIGDFTHWKDYNSYKQALTRLLRDITVEQVSGNMESADAQNSAPNRGTQVAHQHSRLMPISLLFHTHTPDGLSPRIRGFVLSTRPSRRVVITSLVGGGGVVIAGGIGLGVLFSHKENNKSLFAAPTAPNSDPLSQLTLYVATWFDHSIYALRASDGRFLWRSQGGSHSDEAMAIDNGILFCGSDDHSVYALKAKDGRVLWRYQTGGIISSSPKIANGIVYVGSWDNTFYALRASDGSLLWKYATGGKIYSSPAIANSVVYFGSGDGNLYALHINDSRVLWRHYSVVGSVYGVPTVVNGTLYVGASDQVIYALNTSDGSLRWHYQTGGGLSPTVVDGVVYIDSADTNLYALQASDGSLLWRQQIGQQGGAQPIVVNGIIYVCSVDSNVYALRASDRSLLWRYQTAGFMGAKPVIIDDVIFIGGSSGLYALRRGDGTFLWKFEGPVTAPVVG